VPDNEIHQTIPTIKYIELPGGCGVLLREAAPLRGVQPPPALRLRAHKQLATPADHADTGAAPGR
jgi:hypothetical protein